MRFRGAYCTLGWVKSNKNSPSQLYMHIAVLFMFIYCTVQYCTVQYCTVYSYILSFSLMLSGFLIRHHILIFGCVTVTLRDRLLRRQNN